uniref:Transmembrane protein 104 n=1 Tax=Oryzias latipes TaxID=8090 RepID=A0A3P9HLF6_ORYLA
MAGGITDRGEPYSPFVGLVYMFNLIVGTGALTMPKAFATAGWVVSLALICFLAFMSYMTTTFVIEAMAAANAQLRWKRREQEETDYNDSTSEDSDDGLDPSRSEPETKPILSVQRSGHADHFDIVERVEMGQMASMFFNKVGVNMFYICIIVYLYGDLAIYAAAVPISLMEVACGNRSCSAGGVKFNDTDVCWGPVTRADAYRVFLSVFTLLLGPFTFFNAQKTKYLQILTSLMRWIAFTMMIVLALIRIGKGTGEGRPPLANLRGVPNLFGVCVYSFMCQHSLPSLVTPISEKKRLAAARHVHAQLHRQLRRAGHPGAALLPRPLPRLHHQHQLPHHCRDAAQQLEDPVPPGWRHLPVGGGPGGVSTHNSGAPNRGGLLHTQPGVPGGHHRLLRRNGDPVCHPGLPGVYCQAPSGARDGQRVRQQAPVALSPRLLGVVCPAVGCLLPHVCHGQHHPDGHHEMSRFFCRPGWPYWMDRVPYCGPAVA